MRKEILLPVSAVVLGAGGLALRRWELATAFEETGLVTPGMPSTLALGALSIVAAVLFLALALLLRPVEGKRTEEATLKGDTLALSSTVLGAFLLLGSAALGCLELGAQFRQAAALAAQGKGGNPVLAVLLPFALTLLCLGSGVSLLSVGKDAYRGGGVRRFSGTVLLPAYTCCIWLISAYQGRASDPVVQDYLYELLAIICALLDFYYVAGSSFEHPRPGKTMFFSLCAVYFCLVTLADEHSAAELLRYGGCVFALMPAALGRPLGPRMPGEEQTIEERMEEPPHE